MADTIKNIKLPAGQWVDLYAESGVTVGTQIITENLTQTPTKLYAGATVPANAESESDSGYFSRLLAYQEKVNDSGDAGAWAYSATTDGLVNVKVFA